MSRVRWFSGPSVAIVLTALALPLPSAAAATMSWPSGVMAVAGWGMYWMNPNGAAMHTVSRVPAPLTENARVATDGVVSPFGNRAAFILDGREGPAPGPLVVANLDGSAQRTLVNTPVTRPSWSPDGKRIVFNGADSSGRRVLKVVNATGTPVVTIVGGSVGLRDAAFNPKDGAELVATRPGANGTVATQIVLLKAGVAKVVPGISGRTPSMSVDGRIVYQSETKRSGHYDWAGVAIANRNGSDVRMLTTADAQRMEYDQNPAWSPDASMVYFSRSVNEGSNLLLAMPSDGSAAPIRVGTVAFQWLSPIRTSFAPQDRTPPAGVTSLVLRLNTAHHPVLSWTNSKSVDFSHVVVTRTSTAGTTRIYGGRATSFTDGKVSVFAATRNYTYSLTAVDGVGNASATASARTRPAMSTLRVPTLASSASTTALFRIAWASVNPVNPVGTRYRIWWLLRTATTETGWRYWTTTTQASAIFGRNGSPTAPVPGGTYYFRVRAVDRFGQVSAPAFARVIEPYDDTAGRYTGTWTARRLVTSQWLGTLHSTGQLGATMRLTRPGTRYYLIGERGPSTGAFDVYLDGVYQATVDTRSSTLGARRVLWTSSPLANARRTLTVVSRATPGRPQVRIDAVAVQH